jgi:hypothetical protein
MYSYTYIRLFRTKDLFLDVQTHSLTLSNNSLIIFRSVNYVCIVSVVLWYLLIGLLANVSSGITGTDTYIVSDTSGAKASEKSGHIFGVRDGESTVGTTMIEREAEESGGDGVGFYVV